VTSSDELFVIETENRVVRVQELGVEDDLYSIGISVEELNSSDLVEDRVVGIVSHVVSDDRRKGVAAESEHSSLEEDLVFRGEEFRRVGNFSSVFTENEEKVISRTSQLKE